MDALSLEVQKLSAGLDEFILPGTLMACFEAHRLREMRKAAERFTDNELTWFLQMMNELRGAEDRKEDFDLLFDPSMYMYHDAAWDLPPGRSIALPKLNTQVLATVSPHSDFAQLARNEADVLRTLALSYPDDAMIGLATVAAAAYADTTCGAMDREASIRYLAVNASAKLEDLWAENDSLWIEAGTRTVELTDVVKDMKAHILEGQKSFCEAQITEEDLTCYTDDQVKHFAFNPDRFLLSGKTKHMPLCGLCQERTAGWVKKVKDLEVQLRSERGGLLPQA